MSRRLALFVAVAVASTATVAHADDPAERAAKRHYQRGEKLYGLKKYEEALDEYQKAYDADPEPPLLFNIAQCYRNLGNYEDAVFTYKRYLKEDPEASNREKVERLITDLNEKIDKQKSEELHVVPAKKTPEKTTAPIDDGPHETEGAPIYKKWWFWTGLAVVGAGAGIGVYELTKSSGPDATFSVVWPK